MNTAMVISVTVFVLAVFFLAVVGVVFACTNKRRAAFLAVILGCVLFIDWLVNLAMNAVY